MGSFSVHQDGQPVSIPGRNDRRLLALLVMNPGRIWTRREIAARLWPYVEFEVSGNRLRTALVGLKKALSDSDAIEADPQSIALRAGEVESDVAQARALEKRVALAANIAEERSRLEEWIEALGPGLLPDWDDEWLSSAQEDWRQRRIAALQKSAELALADDDLPAAIQKAQAVLDESPYDSFAWNVFLDAMAKSGRNQEAARRFGAARRRMSAEGLGDFPDELLKVAKSVRDGSHGPAPDLPSLPVGVDQAIVRAFQRMLLLDPASAMKFVSHDAFRLEILRNLKPSIQLLESMLGLSPKEGPEWTSLALMAMRTHSLLRDVDRVLEIGTELLSRELAPLQRRLVLSLVSFSHYLIRDFDKAFYFVDQAVEVAETHGLPHHVYFTRADRAIYLWHIGKDEEALRIFIDAFEGTKDESEAHLSYAPAFLSGVIGQIYLMRGDIDPAEEWLRRGHAYAQVRHYREQMHQIEPAYAVVRALRGAREEAGRLIVNGLSYPIRSGNVRAFGASLDFTAAALVELGIPELAAACLHWGEGLRRRYRHERSVAEAAYADRIRESVPNSKPGQQLLKMNQPRKMLHAIADVLHPVI